MSSVILLQCTATLLINIIVLLIFWPTKFMNYLTLGPHNILNIYKYCYITQCMNYSTIGSQNFINCYSTLGLLIYNIYL